MTRSRFGLVMMAALALMLAPTIYADSCASLTDCTYDFTVHNVASFNTTITDYGTVRLQLSGGTITVTITLLNDATNGFRLIGTGQPGAFAFNDTTNEALTFGGFPTGYSGGTSCTTSCPDQHFDGFGLFDDVFASTTAPSAGTGPDSVNALSTLSFTVCRAGLTPPCSGTGAFSDVHQLVDLSHIPPGDAQAFFVADVFQFKGCTGSCTGLIAVGGSNSVVPEPTSYIPVLSAGFGAIVFLVERRRRKGAGTVK